jgi:exopolysaccharide production protein ExoZ
MSTSLGILSTPDRHTAGEERLPCLDALRGAMALAVACYHFAVWTHVFKPGGAAASSVAALGIYSVQGFFVISGLCFFHAYQSAQFDAPTMRAFYLKRFFRIAPLFYLVLAVDLVLGQAIWPQRTAGRLIENLTLSFGLFHPNHSMVLGGWSIGIECLFYAAFPALLWLSRRRPAFLLACALLGVLACVSDARVAASPEPARFNAYVQLSNHAFLFALGGVIATLRSTLPARLSVGAALLGIALGIVVLSRQLPPVYDHFALMHGSARIVGVAACVTLVCVCAFASANVQRWFWPFRALGELSYAVYLLHPLAWLMVRGAALPPALTFGLGLALTLALSALVHVALERPLLGLGRRLAHSSRARRDDAAPGTTSVISSG